MRYSKAIHTILFRIFQYSEANPVINRSYVAIQSTITVVREESGIVSSSFFIPEKKIA